MLLALHFWVPILRGVLQSLLASALCLLEERSYEDGSRQNHKPFPKLVPVFPLNAAPPATTPNCPQRSEKQARWHQRWGLQHPRALLLLPGPRHGIPAAGARPGEDREAEQKGAPWRGLSFHLRASPALQEGCKGLRLAPGCRTHHSQVLILPARRLGGGRCDAQRSAGGLRRDRERQLARVAMKQNGLVELHAAPQQLEIGLAT